MTRSGIQNWAFIRDADQHPVEVDFQEWRCHVIMQQYAEGAGLCLRLMDAEDGSPIARATVNLTHHALNQNEVLIKNYSENEGVLESLVAAGLIRDTGKTVNSEYATLHVAALTPAIAEQWDHFRGQQISNADQRSR